jgi:hypothetical protein
MHQEYSSLKHSVRELLHQQPYWDYMNNTLALTSFEISRILIKNGILEKGDRCDIGSMLKCSSDYLYQLTSSIAGKYYDTKGRSHRRRSAEIKNVYGGHKIYFYNSVGKGRLVWELIDSERSNVADILIKLRNHEKLNQNDKEMGKLERLLNNGLVAYDGNELILTPVSKQILSAEDIWNRLKQEEWRIDLFK